MGGGKQRGKQGKARQTGHGPSRANASRDLGTRALAPAPGGQKPTTGKIKAG